MNHKVFGYFGIKLEKREEYAVDYVSELLEMYKKGTNFLLCLKRKHQIRSIIQTPIG